MDNTQSKITLNADGGDPYPLGVARTQKHVTRKMLSHYTSLLIAQVLIQRFNKFHLKSRLTLVSTPTSNTSSPDTLKDYL